ncbi:MAG TPA: hypothetical protein VL308_10230 [Gemmatimonadaceae bacterium]|nr:hypothetical protein [Gemmatimonadaceae bacterium]
MTARLALVVATVMISATTALAQRADSLRIGARVRVQPIHRPPPQVAGEVVAVDSVGLTLKDSHGSPQFVPLDEINRLERYDGRISSFAGLRRGARRGLMIGLGASAVIWAIAVINTNPSCGGDCLLSPKEEAAVLTVGLTAVSTTLGGIIGSQYRAVWTSLPIPGCPDIVQCRKRPSAGSQAPAAAR